MQENLIRGGTTLFFQLSKYSIPHSRSNWTQGVQLFLLGGTYPSLGGGGGWYSDIFIHTWTRSILGVHNFEFQYFWGFRKNKYFPGYEDFVDIFGVITILYYI